MYISNRFFFQMKYPVYNILVSFLPKYQILQYNNQFCDRVIKVLFMVGFTLVKVRERSKAGLNVMKLEM